MEGTYDYVDKDVTHNIVFGVLNVYLSTLILGYSNMKEGIHQFDPNILNCCMKFYNKLH